MIIRIIFYNYNVCNTANSTVNLVKPNYPHTGKTDYIKYFYSKY
jgi:hypothetical protein